MQLLCQTQQPKVPLLPRRVLGAKGMEGPGTGPCFALVGAHGVRHRNVFALRWIIISVNEFQEMSLSGITVMNGFGFWSPFPALVTVSVSHQSWGNAFKDQESFPGSQVRFSRQCFQGPGKLSWKPGQVFTAMLSRAGEKLNSTSLGMDVWNCQEGPRCLELNGQNLFLEQKAWFEWSEQTQSLRKKKKIA